MEVNKVTKFREKNLMDEMLNILLDLWDWIDKYDRLNNKRGENE